MPSLGIATAPGRVPVELAVIDAMRELSPAFVLHRTDSQARGLQAASRFAQAVDAPVRLEAFGESVLLADAIERTEPESVAPYYAGTHVMQALAKQRIPLTGGTFTDFVMVNRNGIASAATRVTFALCPTVHARDDRSLIESLDTLPGLFAQATRIAGTRPLDVGPCTLFRRLLPKTGRPATRGPKPHEHDYDVDPRQHEPIAAAWLACAIAVAAVSGVSSVCTFEAEGDRGLVRLDGDARRRTGALAVVRSPSHAVVSALARGKKNSVVLYDLNALQGAAFVLTGEPAELWLVDLSGHARGLSSGIRALGSVRQLQSRPLGARWSLVRASRRINGYAIARIALRAPQDRRVVAIARAWCGDGGLAS